MSPMEQLAKQEYERGYSDGKSDFFAAGVAEGEMRARQRMIANRVAANQHPFAASGKPIDHIADAGKMVAEPVKQEPVAWDWILGRPYMCHPKMTEKEVAFADGWNALRDRLIKGKPTEWVKRALEAEEINTRLSFELDQLLSPTHMGEPVIHAAPVQPVKQEPVAWMWKMHGWVVTAHGKHQAIKSYVDVCQPPLETQASDDFIELVPLYAAPVSTKREWVELTDDEIYDALAEVRFVRDNLLDGCRALIAALKEKNK